MYFIAAKSRNGWKAINRQLFPTKADAQLQIDVGYRHSTMEYKVMDADHEPGKSILKARHGFA